MALIGPITINGSTGNSNWAFKTVVTETAVSTAAKTSTVKVENFLGRTNSASYFAGTYTQTFEAGGQTHTETVYKSSGNIAAGEFVSMGSHTFVITQTTTPLSITVKGSYYNAPFSPSSASAEGEVTLSKLHEAPVFGDVSWQETGSALSGTGIGGDYFVPHLSIKQATVSPLLYDNATLTETRITNETNVYKSTSGSPTIVTMDLTKNQLYTIYDASLKRTVPKLSFGFTDSTGATSEWAYPYTYLIPYVKPNLVQTSSSVKRNGQVSGKINLNLTGTFYNAKIGSKSNTMSLSFKYWRKGTTEPTTYYSIPSSAYTISGNTVSMNNWNVAKSGTVITDVNKSYVYLLKIKATDAFGQTSEIQLTCPKGEWLMAKFKDRIDFKKIVTKALFLKDENDNEVSLIDWLNTGRSIRLHKTSQQNLSAQTTTIVSWQEEAYNDTNGILVKDGNYVKVASDISSVLVTAQYQNYENTDKYIYIRRLKADGTIENVSSLGTVDGNISICHQVPVEKNDKIYIEAYSTAASTIQTDSAWVNFNVTILK